jgi:hypothetical protein
VRCHIFPTDIPSSYWCGSFNEEHVPMHRRLTSNNAKNSDYWIPGYFVWAPLTTNPINTMCISDVPFQCLWCQIRTATSHTCIQLKKRIVNDYYQNQKSYGYVWTR